MKSWIFKDYQDNKQDYSEFIPMQTIVSEEFGRHFFIDIGFHFISAPSFKDGGYDASQLDYVGNWTDLEGIDLDKLLEIYRKLCSKQLRQDRNECLREYYEMTQRAFWNG